MLFFLLRIYLCVCASVFAEPLSQSLTAIKETSTVVAPIPVLPEQLNEVLNKLKPILQAEAIKKLPQTYGNCREGNPPQPCSGSADLYYKKTNWYKVKARWITGLKDMTIKKLSVRNYNKNNIVVEAQIHFSNLPLSLVAKGCVKWLGCTTLLDNTNSCCGPNHVVSISVQTSCHQYLPFLRNPQVLSIGISPSLHLEPKIFGSFKVKIKNITTDVEKELERIIASSLSDDLVADANSLISQIYGNRVKCM